MAIQHITEIFTLDGPDFIIAAYLNLLQREPDPHGLAYYLGRLDQGHSKTDVIFQLSQSKECRPHDEIEGLRKLISTERRAQHWLWQQIDRRARLERKQQAGISVLQTINKNLSTLNESTLDQKQALNKINEALPKINAALISQQSIDSTDCGESTHNLIATTIERVAKLEQSVENLRNLVDHSLFSGGTKKQIFFDITSLMEWTRPPVGIIRTLYEIVNESLHQKIFRARFFAFNNSKDFIINLDNDFVKSLAYALTNIGTEISNKIFEMSKEILSAKHDVTISRTDALAFSSGPFGALFDPARLISKDFQCPFRKNDTVVSVGLDWDKSNYELMLELKKKHSFKFVGAFYDGIPIQHPHYLPTLGFCQMFFRYFYNLSMLSDVIFTISEKSKSEYGSIINQYNINGCQTINFIRLGDPRQKTDETIKLKHVIPDGNFVIYVSTIEKRKNHILLMNVWQSLMENLENECPKLICIGMWGWGVDDVQVKMQDNKKLQEYVWFLDDVDDDELAWFYKNAQFAVFPSHAEGWGLGASESLTYGLPCITSTDSALIEATQNLMPSCSPCDSDQWVEQITKLVTDDCYLNNLRGIAMEKYVSRSWNEFSEEFFDMVMRSNK